jgi:monofunctional biosynthetic peptidoglycan transglycosylase
MASRRTSALSFCLPFPASASDLQGAVTIVSVLRKALIALLAVAMLFIVFEMVTWPDVGVLATHPPSTTAFMERRRAELRAAGKDDTLTYRFVPYGRISPYLRRAVLVAEDDTFYEHDAIDVKGIEAAIQRDLRNGKLTHGGSTITQQLAKNLYLSPSRNPFRKLKEYFLARSLERHLTKKRILELYLNVVELGERLYGAEAAARFYFHESAASLAPSQAALLAGCLPNPRIMNPERPNKRLRWRQRMILSRMHRWGYLLEEEVLTAKKPPEPAAPTPAPTAAPTATTDTDLAPPPPADTPSPASATTDSATPAPSPSTDATSTGKAGTETAPPP